MELASVILARAVAWIEPGELNGRGHLFYPDFVKAVVARYGFLGYPQKLEDFDENKGVTFSGGKLGNSSIQQIIIYAHGIVVDTQASTQDSKRLLEEALEWASKEFGLKYKPSMIQRWQYASQITFRSNVQLTCVHPALQRLVDGASEAVTETLGESLTYEVTSITVDYDQLTRKNPLGRFSIQRRDNTPFSENKYFSDAPLQTNVHIRLLEQFEADVIASSRTAK